jgi:hypothetical protein
MLELMRTFLALILLPIASVAAEWPGVSYSEVRAYTYNKRGTVDAPIISHGGLSPSVINESGVALTAPQARHLVRAVNHPNPINSAELCFQPHHAFVFYDRHQRPVAWLEFSQVCNTVRSFPEHAGPIDLLVLGELIRELRLPAFP